MAKLYLQMIVLIAAAVLTAACATAPTPTSLPRPATVPPTPVPQTEAVPERTDSMKVRITLFYRDFGYASGLVILGKIDSAVQALDVPGPIEATVELIK
jgi:hypothetical protein